MVSIRFFVSSAWSNLYANIERVAITAFGTKGGIDLRQFKNIFGTEYGWQKGISVLKGGIVAMDTIRTEINNNITKSRPEKLRLGGLSSVYATFSDYGKRTIDVHDTLGIISVSDMHYRTILQNKYYDDFIEAGFSEKEARILAREQANADMEFIEEEEAKRMTDIIYSNDGIVVDDNFRNTSKYKVTFEEIKRSNRDEEISQRAFLKASEDFFKTIMTEKSEFGGWYNGLFGQFAILMQNIKNGLIASAEINAKNGNVKTAMAQKALGLSVFGFLNGTSAFAEKSLEIVPLYGFLKIAGLQYSGKKINNELRNEIGQKQRDIAIRMALGLALYGMMRAIKAIAEENCDNKNLKIPESDIFGKYRMNICGKTIMPFLIPPQLEPAFAFYNWLFDTKISQKKDDLLEDSIGVVVGLLSNARIGADQPSIKMIENLKKGLEYSNNNNEIAAQESYSKSINYGIGIVVNYANTFLPITTRPIQEVGSYLSPNQLQNRPIFDIKNPNDVIVTIANATKYQLANLFILSSFAQVFINNKKPLLDWQGRTVVNLRAGYFVGDGIQYNKYDDLFAQAKASLPYISPYSEIETEILDKQVLKSPLSKKGEKVIVQGKRYLTEDELYEVQKNVGKFTYSFFEKNYDEYIKMDIEKRKRELDRFSKMLSDRVNKALGKGIKPEEIEIYLNKKMKSSRQLQTTISVIE